MNLMKMKATLRTLDMQYGDAHECFVFFRVHINTGDLTFIIEIYAVAFRCTKKKCASVCGVSV